IEWLTLSIRYLSSDVCSSDMPKPSFNLLPGGKRSHFVLVRVSTSYPKLVCRLTTCYSPIRLSIHRHPPEGFSLLHALDLHVLGTPPAFVLSQDQTLHDRKI